MPRKVKRKDRFVNLSVYAVLILFGLIWGLPIFGIVAESFYCPGAGAAPWHWGLDNYIRLFRETLFLKWFANTLMIGVAVAIVQTGFQLAVGYALSQFSFRGSKFLTGLLYVLGMLPAPLALVVVRGWLCSWDLTGVNAPYGSILVYTASSGLGYSAVKSFFDTFDRSIGEAAQVDGATQLQIFFRIFLPSARPIIIYTLLTGFLLPWSGLSSVDAVLSGYTVADGLAWIASGPVSDSFQTFCAGSVVVSVPLVTLFFLLQRYYIAGEMLRLFGRLPRPNGRSS